MRKFVARHHDALGIVGVLFLLMAMGGALAYEAKVAVPGFMLALLFGWGAVWGENCWMDGWELR